MEEMLVTEEVAQIFRTTPATVRYWRATKTGPPATRIGRRVLYAKGDVERWLEQLRAQEDRGVSA